MEILIIGIIIVVLLQFNHIIDASKFAKDNRMYFNLLKEKDYEFYVKARYGDGVDIEKLFMSRIRLALIVLVFVFFIFISSINVINIAFSFLIAFFVYKLQYMQLKSYYKAHLHEIDSLLPYYLKSLEILIQHYTVPVALGKSIETAPDIFKSGLKTLIAKINAGDSSIDPYMDFAKEYPVRDSMRMMRLLYRLGLGANENKHQQLVAFSRSVSVLQNKSREMKYKNRLEKMEGQTMVMLVVTGGGAMVLMLISIFLMMGSM